MAGGVARTTFEACHMPQLVSGPAGCNHRGLVGCQVSGCAKRKDKSSYGEKDSVMAMRLCEPGAHRPPSVKAWGWSQAGLAGSHPWSVAAAAKVPPVEGGVLQAVASKI